jgi:hypothetical protein
MSMSFDWPRFLTQHNIPYITTGKVGRNDLGCQCPFCGNADTGYNMSISLIDRGWYCWKQPDGHRGRTPHRLIQALIGCSYTDAETMVNKGVSYIPNDGDMLDRLHALFRISAPAAPVQRHKLTLPDEFRPITNIGMGRMFVAYLQKRGFDLADIPRLVNEYALYYCVSDSFMNGAYSNRLIFTIELDGELVSWTGRHIGSSKLRYNSLSTETNPAASLTLKNTILWYDRLRRVDRGTLVVCEGPFDALKLNYLGNAQSIYATCVYGSTMSETQIDLLQSLAQFNSRIVLLDGDAAIRYECNFKGGIGILESLGFRTRILPNTIKDPGEFNKTTFAQLFNH